MPAPHLRAFAGAVAALILAAACHSGSGSASPTATPTGTTGGAANVDTASVDAALSHVLTGLRAATAISASDGIPAAARSLHTASSNLTVAGDALNPPPARVPSGKALPVSTGLLRVAGLLGQASQCLSAQVHAKSPSTRRCLPPLRRAERRDASLAHGLISLAVYGSTSPRRFESELVAALHGK